MKLKQWFTELKLAKSKAFSDWGMSYVFDKECTMIFKEF